MQVTILGKRWELRFVPRMRDDGQCDSPRVPGKEIRIRKSLRGQEKLETVIHEIMHAGNWHHSEEHIDQFSHDLARILWSQLGVGFDDEN